MSIEVWLDQVVPYEREQCEATHCTYNPPYPDDDKENLGSKGSQYLPGAFFKSKRRHSIAMDPGAEEVDLTPRPNKKRRQDQAEIDHVQLEPLLDLPPIEDAASELESHHSGHVSPTKQLAFLEDSSNPVIYCDFGTTTAEVPEDVARLRNKLQALADGVGILGFQPEELASLTDPTNRQLQLNDRTRFAYPWTNDPNKRLQSGKMVALAEVQGIVASAISFEEKRAHETDWNEDVHKTIIKAALAASIHFATLGIANVKTASIDPPELADENLPRRVVDYAIVLQTDRTIKRAWETLRPIGTARIKSWNHTTSNNVRSTPIASNIETKAPNKSWTDGKAQLAIWTLALLKRLFMLQQPGKERPKVPAMPLLIVQGHDWHIFIVSQQHQTDEESPSSKKYATVIWQKIDIGNTRNCFDAYKLISVLHLVMDWAETVWRPWFLALIRWMTET